ncbi:hypothetical protein [Hydrocarboniclastica marina]|uniref:hypothetical protein n=1 Tax=Hydrocarboniclastica marina TaxID=2259620 RepID=UPI0010A8547A|nr:hypothetical protein [Hydrocarboniclastica marina]
MRIITILIAAMLSACGASHNISFAPRLDTPGDQLYIESRCEEDTENAVAQMDYCNDALSLDTYRREYEIYQREYKTSR